MVLLLLVLLVSVQLSPRLSFNDSRDDHRIITRRWLQAELCSDSARTRTVPGSPTPSKEAYGQRPKASQLPMCLFLGRLLQPVVYSAVAQVVFDGLPRHLSSSLTGDQALDISKRLLRVCNSQVQVARSCYLRSARPGLLHRKLSTA